MINYLELKNNKSNSLKERKTSSVNIISLAKAKPIVIGNERNFG